MRKLFITNLLPGHSGCTSEVIVKRNGNRDTCSPQMEKFNFGPSVGQSSVFQVSFGKYKVVDAGLHYKFDIAPHREFDRSKEYIPYNRKLKPARVIDFQDLFEKGKVVDRDLRI